ncbi:MAG: helix-turn-helix domain-containing protein [Polyangiales bacterium]
MPPTTIAILGAKGGVGTTLLSANLAVYLATIGKRVVAVDADPAGSDLMATLGVGPRVAPYVAPTPAFGDQDEGLFAGTELDEDRVNTLAPRDPVEGPVPGMWILHGGLSEPHRGSARRSSLRELQGRLAKHDADFAVVDLGAGSSEAVMRFWCRADHRLAVTMPEPNAVTGLYRILRKTYAQMALQCAEDEDDRAVLHEVFARAGHAPAPSDIRILVRRESPALGRALGACMADLDVPFVVNQARLRADLDVGDQIAAAARRRLGVHLHYLGYVEHDDAVRTTSLKRRPLLTESPGTRASRHIEKIGRRLLAPKDARRQRLPWRDVPDNSHYDVLEVERGATEEEIRRAHKRMSQIFNEDNIVTFGLFDAEGLEAARARVDEAYSVLLDPALRRPYEASVFPEVPDAMQRTKKRAINPADLPPAPTIEPDTEFSGELLRAVRESQGTDLDQISAKTKVGLHYLQCIEDDEFEELPAAVYVRGFVTEFAKCLALDPDQVSQTYLRRYLAHFETET